MEFFHYEAFTEATKQVKEISDDLHEHFAQERMISAHTPPLPRPNNTALKRCKDGVLGCKCQEPSQADAQAVATLILGGIDCLHNGPEYGDIDIELIQGVAEKLQVQLVKGTDPVYVTLYTRQADSASSRQAGYLEAAALTAVLSACEDFYALFNRTVARGCIPIEELRFAAAMAQLRALKAEVSK